MNMIKKIFSFLSAIPAFTNLFKKAAQTGKVDPVETLSALSSISPSTQKCADTAARTVQNGGNIQDVLNNLKNVGEVEVMGQKINTRTLTQDLRKSGGICAMLANLLDGMGKQTPAEIIKFGEAASDLRNYEDLVNK